VLLEVTPSATLRPVDCQAITEVSKDLNLFDPESNGSIILLNFGGQSMTLYYSANNVISHKS